MSPKKAGVHIPPERQSKRIQHQPQVKYHGLDPTNFDAVPFTDLEDSDGTESEVCSEPELESSQDVFRPPPKLPPPKQVNRTLGELFDLMKGNLKEHQLEFNPEYQRDVVWKKPLMTKLIDSLMEEYPIPPVIFILELSYNEDGTTSTKHVCVDGKQRLSSIRDFMDGLIGCHDAKGRIWYYSARSKERGKGSKQKRKRYLPDYRKEEFRDKELVCHEYTYLSKPQEEELFSRVQLGVQLSSAGKLRATDGSWHGLVKSFERDYSGVARLADLKRSRSYQNILHCFAQIVEVQNATRENRQPSLKNPLSTSKKFVDNSDVPTDYMKSHLSQVFSTFDRLRKQEPETFMSNYLPSGGTTITTMEMVAIAVLISEYMEEFTDLIFHKQIRAMRVSLRGHTKDAHQNSDNWRHLWTFIKSLKDHDGNDADDGSRQASAQSVEDDGSQDTPPALVNYQTPSEDQSARLAFEYLERQNIENRSRRSADTWNGSTPARDLNLRDPSSPHKDQTPPYTGAAKRKRSPTAASRPEKRQQLPTPVSPGARALHRIVRVPSVDSLLGDAAIEDSDDENEPQPSRETAEQPVSLTTQTPPRASTEAHMTPPRLVRSSFKTKTPLPALAPPTSASARRTPQEPPPPPPTPTPPALSPARIPADVPTQTTLVRTYQSPYSLSPVPPARSPARASVQAAPARTHQSPIPRSPDLAATSTRTPKPATAPAIAPRPSATPEVDAKPILPSLARPPIEFRRRRPQSDDA